MSVDATLNEIKRKYFSMKNFLKYVDDFLYIKVSKNLAEEFLTFDP